MFKICFAILLLALSYVTTANAQGVLLGGTIKAKADGAPVEYATVMLKECELWAITDSKGRFAIKNVPTGNVTLTVRCLGFATYTAALNIKAGMPSLNIALNADNLKLNEVEVVAKRKADVGTTSYTIDRLALDNRQALNLGDIMSLLPGGKTWNSSLLRDTRIALRSSGGEMGNASFGTAIEVDGVRLDNNATPGETLGAGTRTLSTANIESVEVVTGV
ncbi:TonB-dependent receptor, partial [Hoylesella shahii]